MYICDMTRYICFLPTEIQNKIRSELQKQLSETEVEIAMSGRLCDIEDVIDITRFL